MCVANITYTLRESLSLHPCLAHPHFREHHQSHSLIRLVSYNLTLSTDHSFQWVLISSSLPRAKEGFHVCCQHHVHLRENLSHHPCSREHHQCHHLIRSVSTQFLLRGAVAWWLVCQTRSRGLWFDPYWYWVVFQSKTQLISLELVDIDTLEAVAPT